MDLGVYVVKTYGRVHKWIYHWAVLVVTPDGSYVYHNSEYNEINANGGSIKKESWESFLSKYELIYTIKTDLTEDEVVSRTSPLLSLPYEKVFFNCNTYVKRICPDYTPMAQEKYAYITIAVIGLFILISPKIAAKL